ncbi:MAG: hypothetical protein ACRDL7_06670, partial [Gaiellaceae bacterium]
DRMAQATITKLAIYIRLGGDISVPELDIDTIIDFNKEHQKIGTLKVDVLDVKLTSDKIPSFDGDISKWESWKKKVISIFGQTRYKNVLKGAVEPNPGDPRNMEAYHMLQGAVLDGSAETLVSQISTESGWAAWNALIKWYDRDTRIKKADEARTRLERLRLDIKTTAHDYINNFTKEKNYLNSLREGYTEASYIQRFVTQITDPAYDPIKAFLNVCEGRTFDRCVQYVRDTERTLDIGAPRKLRRLNTADDASETTNHRDQTSNTAVTPTTFHFKRNPLRLSSELFQSFSAPTKDLWRAHVREVRISDSNSTTSNSTTSKGKSKRRKPKSRRTSTKPPSTRPSTPPITSILKTGHDFTSPSADGATTTSTAIETLPDADEDDDDTTADLLHRKPPSVCKGHRISFKDPPPDDDEDADTRVDAVHPSVPSPRSPVARSTSSTPTGNPN